MEIKSGVKSSEGWVTIAYVVATALMAGATYVAKDPEELQRLVETGEIWKSSTLAVVAYVAARTAYKMFGEHLSARKAEIEANKPPAPEPPKLSPVVVSQIREGTEKEIQRALDVIEEDDEHNAARRAALKQKLREIQELANAEASAGST